MAAFTKQHYETVALVLRSTDPNAASTAPEQVQWERTCFAFINRFRTDNPQFDADRFLLACQGDPTRGRRQR